MFTMNNISVNVSVECESLVSNATVKPFPKTKSLKQRIRK